MYKFLAGAAIGTLGGTVFGAGYITLRAIESETFGPALKDALTEAISIRVEKYFFGDVRPRARYHSFNQPSYNGGHIHHGAIPCHDLCPKWNAPSEQNTN